MSVYVHFGPEKKYQGQYLQNMLKLEVAPNLPKE